MGIGLGAVTCTIASVLVFFSLTHTASSNERSSKATIVFNPLGLASGQAPDTDLPTWEGLFRDQTGKTIKFRMVGTAPPSNTTTVIPVYIVPVKLVFPGAREDQFDPEAHMASNGLTIMQNAISSPIFDSTTDYTQGGTDLGRTQYVDAYQRGNFWSLVSNYTNYHVLLGDPQHLIEKRIVVAPEDGRIGKIHGVTVGFMDLAKFDDKLKDVIQKSNQIWSGALTIFVTYNIYLLQDGRCCTAGYHSIFPKDNKTYTYLHATYIKAEHSERDFLGKDVSTLSHEVGEWMDDPFISNTVNCSNPLLSPRKTLEVADPLKGLFPYSLNDFVYHMTSFVFLSYFGAPVRQSVNGWYSFQNDEPLACSETAVFSVPESDFTVPRGINIKNEITGYYYDASRVLHGFVRDSKRRIATFDPPGSIETTPQSLNNGREATGWFRTSDGISHGFVRHADETITAFDVSAPDSTFPQAINDDGTIAGTHNGGGFLRAADGSVTLFNPSNSRGIFNIAINGDGVTAGSHLGNDGITHGFVRYVDGTVVSFDVEGSTSTSVSGINSGGSLSGYHKDSNGESHGFMRDAGGKITEFDPPGSTNTVTYGISSSDLIVGNFVNDTGIHGFERRSDGTFVVFDPKGSTQTYPYCVNNMNVSAGAYGDATGFGGFVHT